MGDSSVSCAFSGITLYSEPVVFLPLVKSRDAENLVGSRLFGCNSQAQALFSPMTLPYKGELDRYGRLETIEKDQNTDLIERGVGMSIEELTNACLWGEKLTKNGEEILGAGCFIHPAIYDRFSKPITGGKHAGSLWSGQFAGTPHLEAIGCKLHHDLGEETRYRYVYRHPAIAGIDFCTDGKFTNTVIRETGEQLHGFGLNDMQVALKKAGFSIFSKEDVVKARKIQELPEIFRVELKKEVERQKERLRLMMKRLQVEEPEPLEQEVLHFVRFSCSELRFLFDNMDNDLIEKYLGLFLQGKMLEQVAQLTHLLWAFTYANRILMPTITGAQYPEHDVTSVIAGFVNGLAKKRVRNTLTDD